MNHPLLFAGCLGLLAAASSAQTARYAMTPAGSEFHPGNYNNTYPFAGASARYQQIHDAIDMRALNGGNAMVMVGLGFRPAASYTIAARTWDVQLSMSPTTVSSAAMSNTFSANVTSTPTVVLPYTTVNAPSGAGAGTTVPNKLLWDFPFKQLYIYSPSSGNLLWEWQSKNSTYSFTFMDACQKPPANGTARTANLGTGCTATGKSSSAQAQALISSTTASLSLINAPANAQALLWIGVNRRTLTGAGWCGSLYLSPLIAVGGTTDSSGTWSAASVAAASLNTTPYWEAFGQFGFADKSLPGGFGLSDMAAFAGPANHATYVSRLWLVHTANGHENDPTGSLGLNTGLVSMFTIR